MSNELWVIGTWLPGFQFWLIFSNKSQWNNNSKEFVDCEIAKKERCLQDLNLRGETPLDFKSNALTTRPKQLCRFYFIYDYELDFWNSIKKVKLSLIIEIFFIDFLAFDTCCIP